MKKMRRIASLLLAMIMVFSLITAVSAEETGPASITIQNASKGETYTIYKLFDATVSAAQTNGESTSIAYTGDIPSSLTDYFQKDNYGYISVKDGVSDANLFAALKTWAETATATKTMTADGSALVFENIPYGYYVITSTQGGGSAITVDSTRPHATVNDKNSSTPKDLTKTADLEDYNIGDTITYTVKFMTANWNGAGEDARKITSYTITDTLPEFLSDVTVTGITIGGVEYKVNDAVPQFDNKKQIVIPWVDSNGEFLYDNRAEIVITYTAKLTDKAAIDGAGNTNTVTVSWNGGSMSAQDVVYTYAIALKKVDQAGNDLAGATFQFPFYVKEAPDTDGAYIYAGTEAGEGLVNTITTPDSGVIVVKGVKAGTYTITETAAPAGYNPLTESFTVTAEKTGKTITSTTWYLDANGNKVVETTTTTVALELQNIAASAELVVNKTGTELPSTGGMGTTIFYTLGSVMVLAALVLLVTKKRMYNV